MDSGMLWQSDQKQPLGERLAAARAHFVKKYGQEPTTAMVSAKVLENAVELCGLRVVPASYIQPNLLWLGVERAAGKLQERAEQVKVTAEQLKLTIAAVEEL